MTYVPRQLVYRALARIRWYQASELTRRIEDPVYCHGPGLDPAVLGWLCALALGHAQASWEIATLMERPSSWVEDIDWRDLPVVLDRIMPPAETPPTRQE